MNNCGAGAKKSLPFRFHEIATPNKSARNDNVGIYLFSLSF